MSVTRVSGLVGLIVLGALVGPVSAQPCATTVVIDSGGNIHKPTKMKCAADEEVKWEVDNQSTTDLTVSFTNFKVKKTGRAGHPLKAATPEVPAAKSGKSTSSGIYVKAEGDFGGTALPHGVYTYIIKARDQSAKKDLDAIDPELEVTPPTGVGPKGRGRGRGGAR